jgi:hypothetical protein
MHIKLTIIAAMILSLVTVVNGPAFVDAQPSDPFVLNVTKVVEGPGFVGPYGVTVTCGSTEIGFFGIEDGRTISTGDFEFPSGNIAFNDECIVTEVDDGGPTSNGQPSGLGPDTITYACEATMDTTCVNDQTVAFDVSDAGGVGSITITNTYEPGGHGFCEECEPEPPPEAAPDAAAAQPGAVAAQPAFTG